MNEEALLQTLTRVVTTPSGIQGQQGAVAVVRFNGMTGHPPGRSWSSQARGTIFRGGRRGRVCRSQGIEL
jgi:hypothetical protein